MSNLGELKARIIQETTRDDLADDMAGALTTAIRKSIEHYQYERWWFNETRVSVPATPGSNFVAMPAGALIVDGILAMIGGARYRLHVRTPDYILSLNAPQSGQPTDYAPDGDNVMLWPTPTQAYPLLFETISEVAPPLDYTSDVSANAWTKQGEDLIVARSKLRLYRDYLSATLQDTRVISANNQEDEAYSRLRAESNRRMSTGKVSAGW